MADQDLSHLAPYQWKPGESGNPGGRPKSVRKKLLEKLGEQGLDGFTEELAEGIRKFRAGDDLTEAVMWFLEREYPKVSHVNVADTTQRTEAPPLEDTDELVNESIKMLANLASPNIESDLPVQPGTDSVKQ